MFKVIRSNTEIARYNFASDCSIAFKFGFITSQAANVQGQKAKIKVTGSEVKVIS